MHSGPGIHYGDSFQQWGNNNHVTKTVNNHADGAGDALRRLFAELQQANIINDYGAPVPGMNLAVEIDRRRHRFQPLFDAVRGGAGPALQRAAAGLAVGLVLDTVQQLAG
jgi:hypothetical protein